MSNGFEPFFKRLCSETEIKNQSQLARELDVGRAAVSLAKRKDAVPARWILDLSASYGLNPLWLETGKGMPRPEAALAAMEEEESAYLEVPKVRARLSAGGGSFETESQVEGYYSFRADWLRMRGNPNNMVLMEVMGNSMEPEIKEGDMVLIDESRTDVLSGSIYAVGVEDTVMVKRVERLPGTLVLRSDNMDYSPIHLSGDELNNVRVIGKVLWASREYR